MSRYDLSKLIVNDLVAMERSDRYSKGKIARTPYGPTLVRELHAAGASLNYLADRFGCTPQAIGACVNYKTYRDV